MISNNTRFAVGELLHPWSETGGGYEALTVVVKATFSFSPEGHVALAEEQVPVRYADELTGENDEAPSARLPADVVPEKGASDVVVSGHAYLPPAHTYVDTAVQVGSTTAPLRVHGPRLFESVLGGVRISDAVHVDRVPIIYERAYGGVSEDLGLSEDRNPAGVGVAKNPKLLDGKPAPQIEHPSRLHTSAKDAHEPMGYAPLLPHWEPRRAAFGSLDADYLKRRIPLFPRDFSLRYHNQAHPSLMLPNPLAGGTQVALSGLHPQRLLRFELPDWQVELNARRSQGIDEPIIIRADTLVLEPDLLRFELIGRARLRLLRTNRLREIQLDGVET